MTNGIVAADRLRLLIERVERLEEEKKDIGADIADVFQEAKSAGFDTKVMKQCIKLRALSQAERDEADALLETYRIALGMAEGETPIERSIREAEEAEAAKRAELLKDTTISINGGPEYPAAMVGEALDTMKKQRRKAPPGPPKEGLEEILAENRAEADELFERACATVRKEGLASVSLIQSKHRLAFNQAAGLIERMELEGIISRPDEAGKRSILESAVA